MGMDAGAARRKPVGRGVSNFLVKSAFKFLSDLFDGVFEVIEFVDGIGEGGTNTGKCR